MLEGDEFEDDESNVDEKDFKDDKELKFLHTLEVREHITRLWEQNDTVLNLVFGNVFPRDSETQGDNIQSTGPDLFFLKNIIVPPNRFRPEAGAGGNTGQFLHEQSVSLTKIIRLNEQLITLNLSKEIEKKEDL